MGAVFRKNLLFLLLSIGILLTGCSTESKATWEETPTFKHNELTLYGTKGKFGMKKLNGDGDEEAFPVNQGRHYQVYFLDQTKNMNGKKYKIMAMHEDAKEAVELYEWPIEENKSGAKFVLEKAGLWEIEILVDEKPFTSFIVKAG